MSKISKKHLLINFICILFIFSFYFKSYLFLLLCLLLCYTEVRKTLHHLLFAAGCACVLIVVDIQNFKEYIFMLFSIILLSSKLNDEILYVLKCYSFYITILIIWSLMVGEQKYGNYQDVLSFSSRLWLIMPDGKEFNPNPLGLLCALSALGFLVNKKNILAIFPLFILLLTQSRAAIIFLAISYIFSHKFNLKNFLLVLLSLLPFIYIILNSQLSDRFLDDGENGRLDRTFIYYNLLKDNYILGYPIGSYLDFTAIYGSLDNMYLLMILQYGLIGVIFFVYIFFMKINIMKDDFFRLRSSIFFATMFYGLFEGSIAGVFLMWLVFSLCFNNFGKGYIRSY